MWAAELAASMARIGQVQAHLPAPVSVLIAIVAMGAAVTQGLWLVTRHVTVMAHEGAHATMASAVGRKIEGIEFQLNANGVTHHSGSSDALVVVSSPRYAYAISAQTDSTVRTTASPTLKSSFASPWLFQNSASGGPEIVVSP